MTEKILVPVLGESITEATVSKWLKSKGDNINADEPIVELETDKVNLEVPSPINGTLTAVNFKDGDTVEVGAVLGEISEGTGDQKQEDNKSVKKPEKKTSGNVINFCIVLLLDIAAIIAYDIDRAINAKDTKFSWVSTNSNKTNDRMPIITI